MTWWAAGELVALLEYLGTLSGIPKEVLGLTVLAWGNSVGDLSTNTAMARRQASPPVVHLNATRASLDRRRLNQSE